MVRIYYPEKEWNSCCSPYKTIQTRLNECTSDRGRPKRDCPFLETLGDIVHLTNRGVHHIYLKLQHLELIFECRALRIFLQRLRIHAANEMEISHGNVFLRPYRAVCRKTLQ